MNAPDRLPRRAPLRSLRFATDPLLQACLAGEATLQPGLAASAVAKVQQALMDLGYRLRDFGPDCVFGLETAGAVAAFHADIGLGADDRVVSRAAFDGLCASLGSEGAVVSGNHCWPLADPDAFAEAITAAFAAAEEAAGRLGRPA